MIESVRQGVYPLPRAGFAAIIELFAAYVFYFSNAVPGEKAEF